jgi:hypothetical protein
MFYAFGVPLLLVNVGLLVWYFRAVQYKHLWLLPSTFFLVSYALHYPVRMLALQHSRYNLFQLSNEEICLALAYATVFAALFAFTSLAGRFHRNREGFPARWVEETPLAGHLIFAVWAASFAYRCQAGMLFALYEGQESLYKSPLVSLVLSADPLKWFVLAYCVFYLHRPNDRLLSLGTLNAASARAGSAVAVSARSRAGRWVLRLEMWATIGAIMFEAAASTAKGPLVYLLFFYFIGSSLRNRRPSLAVLVPSVALLGAFTAYSYIVRYHGTVRGTFTIAKFVDNFRVAERVMRETEAGNTLGKQGAVDRFSYLDSLALCRRKAEWLERGNYQLGSAIEVLNLIPRFLWPERPHLSFNHHVTWDIWGYSFFSETPVGRIGESYYVLGNAGVLGGVAYALLFNLIYGVFLRRARTAFAWGLYGWLLMVFCVPDAYLTYNLKPTLYLLPVLLSGYWLSWRGRRAPVIRPVLLVARQQPEGT